MTERVPSEAADPAATSRLIPIADPDDPRLAAYRSIRERDLVGREGLFVAEGEVVLRTLIASPTHRTVSVLLAQSGRVERLAPLLAGLAEETPAYLASQGVVDALAGFALHRGVLAIGARRAPPSAEALLDGLPERALVVGLVGLSNHDNVGAAFRNAAAFGADAVLLDDTCCDPLYRKAIRVSAGAVLRMAWARAGSAEAMAALLASRGLDVVAFSPDGAVRLADYARPPRVAALFGAEGPGLPRAILDGATTLAIPMAAGTDSLNVATTVGIALHHLTQSARSPG